MSRFDAAALPTEQLDIDIAVIRRRASVLESLSQMFTDRIGCKNMLGQGFDWGSSKRYIGRHC
jgi:hypothetical protein